MVELFEHENTFEKAMKCLDVQCPNIQSDYAKDISHFDFLYLFTNENLSCLFNKIDVQDKSVLTVGSSGDQVLYAHANGARNIVHFDVNPFAKFYLDYKCAAIRALDFKYFKLFFNQRRHSMLSSELYSKISHDLPEESKLFWDELYLNGFGNKDYQLHKTDSGNVPYSKDEYNKIREALLTREMDITFIHSDVQSISSKLDKDDKFDFILLSNIYRYIGTWGVESPNEVFKTCLEDLSQHLNYNGEMQINYVWDEALSNSCIMGLTLGLKDTYAIRDPWLDEGSIMYSPTLVEPQIDVGEVELSGLELELLV